MINRINITNWKKKLNIFPYFFLVNNNFHDTEYIYFFRLPYNFLLKYEKDFL